MDMHQKRKMRREKKASNEQNENRTSVPIQWYPGHMAKAIRKIKEQLSKVDVVLILGDARCVKTSLNQDFIEVIKHKKYIYVFNKSDLADPEITKEWIEYFTERGDKIFFTDAQNKKGLGELVSHLKNIKQTFRFNREVRVLIAGIPNVGKSMLINSFAHKASAQTGNMPGVTRANRWVKVTGDFYLLDTPGILPPKFETQEEASALAAIGCIKDTILDKEELALNLIKFMQLRYPEELATRYKIDELPHSALEIYEEIGRNRGFKTKGGEIDYERCAFMILDEFRNGKIGRFTFDTPEDVDDDYYE